MSAYDQGPLANYNSLTDRHLMSYFSNDRMRRHLVKNGLITKGGEVVSDSVYRMRIARREHRRRVRDLIAQAIIHKALEMERSRQIDIRKKIEEIAKIELVRRVRTDCNRLGDEECLAYFNEGNMDSGLQSKKSKMRMTKTQSDMDESRLPVTPDQESRMRLRKILPNEEIETKHLSQLDSLTLGEYARILEKQDRYRINKLPYLGMGNENIRRTVKPTRGSKTKKNHRSKTSLSKSENQETNMTQSARSLQQAHTTVSILFHAPTSTRTFEVMVIQQPSGGNTLILYKESIENNTVFNVTSHRHKGFPFSLTFYIDNVKDSRISTCCEYKHKVGKRIGGPSGHFELFSVDGDNPCFKCLTERDLANEKKQDKAADTKSIGQSSSRNETISVRSASEDRYKSDDEFESESSSSNEESGSEEDEKMQSNQSHSSISKSSREHVIITGNIKDKGRTDLTKTPEIEVKNDEDGCEEVVKKDNHLELVSSNNNAVEVDIHSKNDKTSMNVAKDIRSDRSSNWTSGSEETSSITPRHDALQSIKVKSPPNIEKKNNEPGTVVFETSKENLKSKEIKHSSEKSRKISTGYPVLESIKVRTPSDEEKMKSDEPYTVIHETNIEDSKSKEVTRSPEESRKMSTRNYELESVNVNTTPEIEKKNDKSYSVLNKTAKEDAMEEESSSASSDEDSEKISTIKKQSERKISRSESELRKNDKSYSVLDKTAKEDAMEEESSSSSSDEDSKKISTIKKQSERKISRSESESTDDSFKKSDWKDKVEESDLDSDLSGDQAVEKQSDTSSSNSEESEKISNNDLESGINTEDKEKVPVYNVTNEINEESIGIIEDEPKMNTLGKHDVNINDNVPLQIAGSLDNLEEKLPHEHIEPDKTKETTATTSVIFIGGRAEESNLQKTSTGGNNHRQRTDSSDSTTEDYTTSSMTQGTSSSSGAPKDFNTVTSKPILTGNDRESLKIDIPKDEENSSLLNKDESRIEEPRNETQSPLMAERMAIIETAKIPEELEREDNSNRRPSSSLKSSSISGSDSEGKEPIEVEHQSEEEFNVNSAKETIAGRFDVFFENDDISFKKAKEMFEQLNGERVTSLTIKNCELPSYIFNFIANKLEPEKDLKKIELSGCEVELSLLKFLAKTLDKWPQLDSLILSNNVLLDYSLFDLINVIDAIYAENRANGKLLLKLFDVSNCALQENDYNQIIKMIANNTRVENINLDHNPMDNRLWQDLRKALEHNFNVKSVTIRHCVTDPSLLDEINHEENIGIKARIIVN